FNKRKYCDKMCMRRDWILNKTKRNSNERNSRANAKLRIELLTNKRECEKCRSTKNLDVHHMDENPFNNSLENLQVLCRSCHTKQGIKLLRKALSEIQEIWGSSLHEIQNIRIRKLVPIETWRLQGFTDEQFYKAKESGMSNSQLYKQAGNAVTVNVVDAIVKCL